MPKEKSDLDKLKEEYKKIQKKFKLPSFEELNKDFYIEKIEIDETDYLVREIKKSIGDKYFNYLRFIENILNPTSGSMFVLSMVKSISPENRSKLVEIYKRMSKAELDFIQRDLEFSEQKDAEYVKEFFNLWQQVKKELLEIVNSVEARWETKTEGKSKGYFG